MPASRRSLAIVAFNLIFVALFLAPSAILPFSLVLIPFLDLQRTAGRSRQLIYFVLLPLAAIGQLTSAGALDIIELIRIVEIVLFLILVGVYQIKEHVAPVSIVAIVCVLLLFSFGDWFQIGQLKQLKQALWPLADVEFWNYGGIDAVAFRLGSIYYNPNVLGQALISLVPFLVLMGRPVLVAVILPVIGVLVILTGSRTAFVVFAVQLSWYLIARPPEGERSRTLLKLTILGGLGGLVTYVITYAGMTFNTLRALRVVALVTEVESGSEKVRVTAEYFRDLTENDTLATVWRIVFGNGALDLSRYRLDNEAGYILFAFGVVGLLMIGYRIAGICWYAIQQGKGHVNAIWLVSIGATTVFSFRFLVIVLVLYSVLQQKETATFRARKPSVT